MASATSLPVFAEAVRPRCPCPNANHSPWCHALSPITGKESGRQGRWPIQGSWFVTDANSGRSEEHTSELQSLMRISYAVFCLKKKKQQTNNTPKKKMPT